MKASKRRVRNYVLVCLITHARYLCVWYDGCNNCLRVATFYSSLQKKLLASCDVSLNIDETDCYENIWQRCARGLDRLREMVFGSASLDRRLICLVTAWNGNSTLESKTSEYRENQTRYLGACLWMHSWFFTSIQIWHLGIPTQERSNKEIGRKIQG